MLQWSHELHCHAQTMMVFWEIICIKRERERIIKTCVNEARQRLEWRFTDGSVKTVVRDQK